ncbi:MAG: hypothetical protein AzoDbin1_01146 [Azoarcus sp.]|uniref:Uncharacterized protein n=1 Tax=Aromatoleum tolulyticum TaxID=34027 RepID=A0A1N6N843_9RHOO|nr:hypothetical protein [Aromatoleum tolulyticum]MCK9984674.1 hypothetical protein [Azoarcus sp.]SIP88250.1 hypothetical protein SAMN05421829_101158 [Aromatoleum tolulyticum]
MKRRAETEQTGTTAHRHSPAAPYSHPGLRRRLAALRAGIKAAVRALRAKNTSN